MSRFFHRHQKAIIWMIVIAFFLGSVVLVGLNQAGVFNRPQSAVGDVGVTYAARVNGEEIDVASLDAMTNQLFNQYQNLYQQIGQDARVLLEGANGALFLLRLRSDAASEVIRRILYEQEAEERGIRVSQNDVDVAFSTAYMNLLQTNGITEDQLAAYLTQQGNTLESLKASLRAEAEANLLDEAVRGAVAGLVVPTEDELSGYFEENITEYDLEERVRASHILVEGLETALEVSALLDEGADFAELASIYSIDTSNAESGGDVDWFGRGVMVPEFEEAAFSMEIGDLSEPVLTQFGYHIINLTDREAAHTPTLDEVRDDVLADYTSDEAENRVSEWYQGLYDASEIDVSFPLVNAFFLQQQDEDLGLAEFERLLASGEVSDPYLPYYVGRIYETKAEQVADERLELEGLEEPTDEDLTRIEALAAEQETNEEAALASYLAALEDVDADEAFLNRILQLNPDSLSATFLLGKLFLDRGEYLRAEERFAEVIAKDETYVAAYIASGDLAVRNGSYPLARTRYEKALELRANDSSVMLKLVNVHLELGSIAEARGLIDGIQAVDPGNIKAAIAEGDLARAQLAAAVAERDELESKDALSDEESARLSELGEAIDEFYAVAVDRYERGLQSGGSLDLRVRLGDAHFLSGRLDEAEDEFEDVIVRSPYTTAAYEGLGKVLSVRGEIEAALENFRKAFSRSFDVTEKERVAELIVELDPSDVDMRMQLAEVYTSQYKWSAAIGEYAAVLEIAPASLDASLGIAEAYRWRGEYATALEYLHRAIDETEETDTLIRLNESALGIVEEDVGEGEPLGPQGLDVLLELARLRFSIGESELALDDIERVTSEDAEYRADEIAELLLLIEPEEEPAAAEDDASEPAGDALEPEDAASDEAPGEPSP